MFTIEIVMAAYNNTRDMRLVFDGYCQQTWKDFSLCVADDGSGPEVVELVEAYRTKGLNIRHCWHEDKGFRRAEILNKGIESSTADYLVFTDNDCIPSRHFVEDHVQAAERGKFVVGRRVDLYSPVSDRLRSYDLSVARLERPLWLIYQSAVKGLKRPEMALRPPGFLSRLWSRKVMPAVGANMAVWRDDLLMVNGFDADYQGYGMEETDLEWRLLASAVESKSLLGRAALFHLYHEQKQASGQGVEMFQRKQQAGKLCCENGIR